jgi:hypothetical protein
VAPDSTYSPDLATGVLRLLYGSVSKWQAATVTRDTPEAMCRSS